MDQAGALRRMTGPALNQPLPAAGSHSSRLRGLAVASGKGGVGKTNAVANIAYTMGKAGKRALVLDADMGLGNIHILLGLVPRYTLQHVIIGERTLSEVILRGPGGVDILPSGSGSRKYNDLNGEEMLALRTELEALESGYDYVFFDIGAGISSNVTYFCSAAEDVAIITSAEPTSFADAYALMKVLSRDYGKRDFQLIVNSVKKESEAIEVFKRLDQVSDRFGLDIRINYLGHIVHDVSVPKSVREQRLFAERYPDSPAAGCIGRIAARLMRTLEPREIGWGKIFT